MNKTININLQGVIFHIDEDAYLKLTHYFDAVKRSLQNVEGNEEIIKDIELRFAELFTEKSAGDKFIVGIKEVDAVIAIMGQPEDYGAEEESMQQTEPVNSFSKKIYRDIEDRKLGGISSGLGYYLGIEAVWVRFLFVVGFFLGFGLFLYIILWLVIPKAITTSEKLAMKGEPINLSSIEKKVRDEFSDVSNKFKNGGYDQFGNKLANHSSKVGNSLVDVIKRLVLLCIKLTGLFIIIHCVFVLLFLTFGVFSLSSAGLVYFPWQDFMEAYNYSNFPLWVVGLFLWLVVGIPVFFLAILGFKFFSPRFKSVGNTVKYALISVWIIALVLIISVGFEQGYSFSRTNRVVDTYDLKLSAKNPLIVQFKNNPFYSKDVFDYDSVEITNDQNNKQVIYSNDVSLIIKKSSTAQAFIEVVKEAYGKSILEAKQSAEKTNFNFKVENNHLIFDNYWITDLKNKCKGNKIEISLYLPESTFFKLDSSVENYIENDLPFFINDEDEINQYNFQIKNGTVKCVDCLNSSTNQSNTEAVSESLSISRNGVKIISDSIRNRNVRNKFLKINKNGIFIHIN